VLNATVNLATQQAHIDYLPGLVDRQGLVHAVEEAGYKAREVLAPTETTIDRANQNRVKEYSTLYTS
jgi:P-type Cu+ transporter